MDPKEQARNLVNNSCRLFQKYLEEPTNRFLPDVCDEMLLKINSLKADKIREIDSNQVFSKTDLDAIQQAVINFEKNFYYKCNSNYTEADHNICWAFLSAGDSGKVFRYLDEAIYCLSKAGRHWSGPVLNKANWKEKVVEFCAESFKRNNISSYPEWKSKIINYNQFPAALVEEWLLGWESQSGNWIDEIFET